jgi:hypothetical protein
MIGNVAGLQRNYHLCVSINIICYERLFETAVLVWRGKEEDGGAWSNQKVTESTTPDRDRGRGASQAIYASRLG